MKPIFLSITLALLCATANAFPHWAPNTNVQVYLLRNSFSLGEQIRINAAIQSWVPFLPEGITFTIKGETETIQTCLGCLTVTREPTPKNEWGECEVSHTNDVIMFALIRIDPRAGSKDDFQRIMAHEVGHSLGLDHRAHSIMSSRPHGKPSEEDARLVRAMYPKVLNPLVAVIDAPKPRLVLPVIDVSKTARREAETIAALTRCTFRREVVIQTLDDGREYRRISQMVLDDAGARVEKVISHESNLKKLRITKQDEEDFSGAQMGLINFSLHRFSRSPTGIVVEPVAFTERVFKGEIQVDNKGRIVRLEGTTLPEKSERFPVFVSTRKEVGDYLFPAETFAEGILQFPNHAVRIRWRITYSDYKVFGSRVSVAEVSDN